MTKLNLKNIRLNGVKLSESSLVISLSAVLLGLLAGAVFILMLGANPFAAFAY